MHPILRAASPNQHWLLPPAHHASLFRESLLKEKSQAPRTGMMEDYFADEIEDMEAERALQMDAAAPGLALLKVDGLIVYGASQLEEMFFGLYNLERLQSALQQVKDTPGIKILALEMNGPGGYSTAVKETADQLAALGIPTFVYTSTQLASAYYWLACGASAIFAAPYADVGSIGVYNVVVDDVKMYEKYGLSLEYIRDGDYKAMGAPGKPWTEQEKEFIRSGVMACSAEFKGFVTARRPEITADQMQGQCLQASAPAAAGLTDSTEFQRWESFIQFCALQAAAR